MYFYVPVAQSHHDDVFICLSSFRQRYETHGEGKVLEHGGVKKKIGL